MSEIPVVDFETLGVHRAETTKADLRSVGEKVCKAFEEIGFVYLTNFGIASSKMDDVNRLSADFYDKPHEQKVKYSFTPETFYGYCALGLEAFDTNKPGDYKESYDIRAIEGPDAQPLPDEVTPGFSKAVISFMTQCRLLAMRLLEALSLFLGLEGPRFLPSLCSKMLRKGNTSFLRCLRYPAIQGDLPEGQVRLGEHTDCNAVLSFVFQDNVGGLQVKTKEGRFIEATPIPGTVVVNVGDLLQFWTNGRLRSTPHRILTPSDPKQRNACRRSLAFLAHADRDVVISDNVMDPTALDVDDSTSLKFSAEELRGMTVGDFIDRNYMHTYAPKNHLDQQ